MNEIEADPSDVPCTKCNSRNDNHFLLSGAEPGSPPNHPYVTPHQPLLGCPHFNLTAQSQLNTIIHSKPHLSPLTTTTHDARAPQTVRAPPDPVAALSRVHDDVADPPLSHATHALHVLVTRLPLRPPHWMVPRRPAWGEADEGRLGRDLVLGFLRRSVRGRCRVCV